VNRREWNQHADEFETAVCDITVDETHDQLGRYVKATKLSSNSVLVDLGCGLGSFIQKFGNRFQELIGIDYAAQIISRAKRRCAAHLNVTWLVMDVAKAAKVVRARADLTVCLNVITSPSPAKRNALWSCVAKVTKPRGFALIVVPSIESSRMVEEREHGGRRNVRRAPPHDGLVKREDSWQKHFSYRELIAIMSDQGFLVRRIGRVYYPWSTEGLRKPRSHNARPWDWICLAQRA
jgi:SAM-dependent methyltransferase